MMTRHVYDDLAAYAERQLDAGRTARVDRHLAGCAACRTALDEVRRGIALASELEPAPMPEDFAERIRAALVSAPMAAPRPVWPYAAAAVLALIVGLGAYWEANRPWASLRAAGAAPTTFEREGRGVHDRLKRGDLQLAHLTSDEYATWRWLESQRAPVTSLRPSRAPEDRARFVPVGAAVQTVAGVKTSVIEYRIDGRAVTLLLARAGEVADAPSPGLWSKHVTHRRDPEGVNTLTWTVGGGTYVLVSELEGYGQQACFICHTEDRFQEPIMELSLHP
jgi:anti-sigma factor RsiW